MCFFFFLVESEINELHLEMSEINELHIEMSISKIDVSIHMGNHTRHRYKAKGGICVLSSNVRTLWIIANANRFYTLLALYLFCIQVCVCVIGWEVNHNY